MIHVSLIDVLFWVILVSLPLAVIYGKVSKISKLLEEINNKMGVAEKPDIKLEEKTNDDVIRY